MTVFASASINDMHSAPLNAALVVVIAGGVFGAPLGYIYFERHSRRTSNGDR